MSPKSKLNQNKRGVVLHDRAREIVRNVDKYFESEKQHSLALLEDLKTASVMAVPGGDITVTRAVYANIMQTLQNAGKVTERVHLATGIHKNTVSRIRREGREAEWREEEGEAETSGGGELPTSILEPQIKLEVEENEESEIIGY